MPLDGVGVRCLAQELNQALARGRVDRVDQPERFDLVLQLRQGQANKRLLLSANPGAPRVHLTSQPTERPQRPPRFCLLLRKHLLGARLLGVQAPDYERILVFTFECQNDLGDRVEKQLLVELMGRHSNLLFLNEHQVLHDALIQIDHSVNRVRELLPARPYLPPPSQNKQSPDQLLADLRAGAFAFDDTLAEKTVAQALLVTVRGFSPLLCQDLVLQAGLDQRLLVGHLQAADQDRLQAALLARLSAIVSGTCSPRLFYLDASDALPADFHAMPLALFRVSVPVSSLSEAQEVFFTERARLNTLKQKKDSLARRLGKARLQALGKQALHRDAIRALADTDRLQQEANLLLANSTRWQEGDPVLAAIDYYQADQPRLLLPIEAGKTPTQMAQALFRQVARTKRRAQLSRGFLARLDEELAWLDSVGHELDRAASLDDLAAIEEEVQAGGLGRKKSSRSADAPTLPQQPGKAGSRKKRHQRQLGRKQAGPKAAPSAADKLPPRRYVSSDGLVLLVGRNNLQNDRLTFQLASKGDYWFHARHIPGSHVIVRAQNQPLPAHTIAEAASLAAWYSQARRAGGDVGALKVAVDYCPVSRVRKQRGAKPGMVWYDQHQTLLVTPKEPPTPPESDL